LPSLPSSRRCCFRRWLAQRKKLSWPTVSPNLKQLGVTMTMYTGDKPGQFSRLRPAWPQMPLMACWKLLDPYISTNNRAFFRCPADRGKGFNIEWVIRNGASVGISTINCSSQILITTIFNFTTMTPEQADGCASARSSFSIHKKQLCPCFRVVPIRLMM